MWTISRRVAAAILAFATVGPITLAEAAPLSVPMNVERKSDVTDVRIRCNEWGDCDRTRSDRGRDRDGRRWDRDRRDRDRDRVGFRERHRDRDRWEHNRWERDRRWRSRPLYVDPFYDPGPTIIYRTEPRVIYTQPRVVVRPRVGNAHVRWCVNRYQSYNIRTDRFLSLDGYWKRCVSPYDY